MTGTLSNRVRTARVQGAPDEGTTNVGSVTLCTRSRAAGRSSPSATGDRIAFESPMPRGFETRDAAVEAAKEHVRTQFARLGVAGETVDVTVQQAETA